MNTERYAPAQARERQERGSEGVVHKPRYEVNDAARPSLCFPSA